MNIIEDLGKFYNNNKDEILNSLDIKIKEDTFFFVYSKGVLESITNVKYKNKVGNISNKIYGIDEDVKFFEHITLKSSFYMDDINVFITDNKGKKIKSTIPKVIKFSNIKNEKNIYDFDKVKSDNLVEYFYDKCSKVFNIDESYDLFKNNVINHINTFESRFGVDKNGKLTKELILSDVSTDTHFDIPFGSKIVFIERESFDVYSELYDIYTLSKLKGRTDNIRILSGSSVDKSFYILNDNIIYDTFYHRMDNIDENVLGYSKFMDISKYIPNKFLVIDDKFNNSFDKLNNINTLLEDVSSSNIKHDVKIFNINFKGGINYYTTLKKSNILKKYSNLIIYNKEQNNYTYFNYGENVSELTNYQLHTKLINILGKAKEGNTPNINFFEKSDSEIVNPISGNKINLKSLYERIRTPLFDFVYRNKQINLIDVYDTIIKFIIKHDLFYKKNGDNIQVDKHKLIKILELKYNLTGSKDMDNFKLKYENLTGYQNFDTFVELEESLNDKGLDLLENKDDKFMRKYKNKLCYEHNIKKEYRKDFIISDINEFSYMLGRLVKHQNMFSNSITKETEIRKYRKDVSVSINNYLNLRDKFLVKEKVSNRISKLENKIFLYASENKSEKVDNISFMYGYSSGY